MSFRTGIPAQLLLRAVLERGLRTACLALESVRLRAKTHNGLLGRGVAELVQAAKQRAYHRAETLLTQLPAATADATPNGLSSSL